MGLVLQPHEAGPAHLVQQPVVVLHAVDPLLQVVREGLGDGGPGGGVLGGLLRFLGGSGGLLVPGLGLGGLLRLGGGLGQVSTCRAVRSSRASSASWYLLALSYSIRAWESLS